MKKLAFPKASIVQNQRQADKKSVHQPPSG
jgi:hypothetical protein